MVSGMGLGLSLGLRLGVGLGGGRDGSAEVAPVNVLANTYDGMTWLWGVDAAFSTLSQDTAGTTPVTAAGQLVGRATDLAGTDHLLRLVNDTLRPTYQTGPARLEFDGTDGMATAGNVALGTSILTVVWLGDINAAGVASTRQTILATEEGGASTLGSFQIFRNTGQADAIVSIVLRGPVSGLWFGSASGIPTGRNLHMLTFDGSTSTTLVEWHVNDAASSLSVSAGTTTRGSGNFSSQRVRVGSNLDGTLPHTGDAAIVAIGSGALTSAGRAALYADLAGRL